jgi:NDP-sugar pyrophosphorylase family protein
MAELIKTWMSKNAHNFNICYSEEAVDDLLDTGTSFCKAIDHIDNNNPVIVTFCDYIY